MISRVTVAAALCITLFVAQAHACSCARSETALEQAESVDVIFMGRATQTTRVVREKTFWDHVFFWRGDREAEWDRQYVTKFEIERSLKGAEQITISIQHGQYGGMCGVSFKLEQTHLVLAYAHDEETYMTHLCAMPDYSVEEYESALKQPN